jgi:hypothetical protein
MGFQIDIAPSDADSIPLSIKSTNDKKQSRTVVSLSPGLAFISDNLHDMPTYG